jgi:8-oxo-dGTP pyrophosphatase MutT (NUDIX family)
MRGTGEPHGGFNYRVAGIALSGRRLLLHTSDRDDFWSLPGGRCEFGETSAEALVREMREELGEKIIIRHLRWTVENFYDYNERSCHELAFYYSFDIAEQWPLLRKKSWKGRDGELELSFRWFSRGELKELTVYPSFIPEYAFEETEDMRHIVWRE